MNDSIVIKRTDLRSQGEMLPDSLKRSDDCAIVGRIFSAGDRVAPEKTATLTVFPVRILSRDDGKRGRWNEEKASR